MPSVNLQVQDDKDLVHAFVMAEGLTCLIKVGAEADQNYQNYILRALGQIMLYVDGMNGVIDHPETIQWLYTLIGSKFRLVVKTALKLLLVFVEYSESNAALLIKAINTVDFKKGRKQWSNAMEILSEKDGVDTELLVYTTSLINKTLAALPDQDSFYDLVDVLEEQGMQEVTRRYIGRKGTDLDLLEQLNIYEVDITLHYLKPSGADIRLPEKIWDSGTTVFHTLLFITLGIKEWKGRPCGHVFQATLRHEDGDDNGQAPPNGGRDRRRSSVGGTEGRGLERRRSRRHSLGRTGSASPLSPASPNRTNFQPFNGNVNERKEECEDEEDEEETPVTESDDDDDDDEEGGSKPFSVISTVREEEEERRNSAEVSSGNDTEQPSMLASLLARRKSCISVPSCSEVTPSRPLQRLPYLPHSPFHLFSYDMPEEEEANQRSGGRSFSAAPPTPRQQNDRDGVYSLEMVYIAVCRDVEMVYIAVCRDVRDGVYSRMVLYIVEMDMVVEMVSLEMVYNRLPPLGGLLSSSYRQHQESLAAERERRKVEREERLQRIEREERNRHSREFVVNMEEARLARDQ
ncbi:hypothetical protein NFI96_027695, partial [Prochilodus magdalenae]